MGVTSHLAKQTRRIRDGQAGATAQLATTAKRSRPKARTPQGAGLEAVEGRQMTSTEILQYVCVIFCIGVCCALLWIANKWIMRSLFGPTPRKNMGVKTEFDPIDDYEVARLWRFMRSNGEAILRGRGVPEWLRVQDGDMLTVLIWLYQGMSVSKMVDDCAMFTPKTRISCNRCGKALEPGDKVYFIRGWIPFCLPCRVHSPLPAPLP